MADFLSSLFGGNTDSGSPGLFSGGSPLGNRLDAMFMAMASTPPGGATGIPLIQASQVANTQNNQLQEHAATSMALQKFYGFDKPTADQLAWSSSAAQMAATGQASKQMAPFISGMYNPDTPSTPTPSAAPSTSMPPVQNAPTMPSLISPTSLLSPTPTSQGSPTPPPVQQASTSAPTPTATDATDAAQAQITVPPTKTVDPADSTVFNSSVPALAQRASQIAGVSQSSNGPVAVDAGGRPLFNVPGMAKAAQVMMASPLKQYQEMGKSLQSQLETMQKTGVQFTTTGGVMPVAGYAEANARAKQMEETATGPQKFITNLATQMGRPQQLHPGVPVQPTFESSDTGRALVQQMAQRAGINLPMQQQTAQSASPQQPATQATAQPSSPYTPQASDIPWSKLPPEQKLSQVPVIPPEQNPFVARPVNIGGATVNSVTPEMLDMAKESMDQWKNGTKAFNTAQTVKQQLNLMQSAADEMNKNGGWASTGAAANTRMATARAVNTLADVFGFDKNTIGFDPSKVAQWEDLNKLTTQMGMKLAASSNPRGAAQQIIKASIGATPNAENSPLGFALVKNGIEQGIQRDIDEHEFQTLYFKQNHTMFGSDVAFANLHPPEQYSNAAIQGAFAHFGQKPPGALPAQTGQTGGTTSGGIKWSIQ